MMSEVRPPPAPDLPQLPRPPSLHAVLTTPVDRTGACRFLPCSRCLPPLTPGLVSSSSLLDFAPGLPPIQARILLPILLLHFLCLSLRPVLLLILPLLL